MTSAMTVQVNDFAADAIISQLLLLDSQDSSKVHCSSHAKVVSIHG